MRISFRSSGILTGSKTLSFVKYTITPFRSSGILTGSKTSEKGASLLL